MSRNTVAGGTPADLGSAVFSPLPADSAAALSRAAFSPSFFTSLVASFEGTVTGAGAGISDGAGAGSRTFESGDFVASTAGLAASAVLAGSGLTGSRTGGGFWGALLGGGGGA